MTEAMTEKRYVARRLLEILNGYQIYASVDEGLAYSTWAHQMDNARPFGANDISRLNILFKHAVEQGTLPADYSNQPFAAVREALAREAN